MIMNVTNKVTIFSIICAAASIAFLNIYSVKNKNNARDTIMIIQNLFNIPLCIGVVAVNFIDGHDDPSLGLWAILMLLIALPTALGYLLFALVFPAVNLAKQRQQPKPKYYWCNVIVLISEAILAPFMLI